MTESQNAERALRGLQVLISYATDSDRADELAGSTGMATLATDVVADLLHYAHRMKIDGPAAIARAMMHFDAEIAEAREHK